LRRGEEKKRGFLRDGGLKKEKKKGGIESNRFEGAIKRRRMEDNAMQLLQGGEKSKKRSEEGRKGKGWSRNGPVKLGICSKKEEERECPSGENFQKNRGDALQSKNHVRGGGGGGVNLS